jgi:kynurenine formamidase
MIDLTHPLHPGIPTWSGRCGFSQEIKLDYQQGLRAQSLRMINGIGTHLDAPAHFIPGGKTIDQIPLSELIGPALVVRPKDRAMTLNELPSLSELKGAFLLIDHNWAHFWDQPDLYRTDYPIVPLPVAEALVEAGALGLGVDTLSPEKGPEFPIHLALLQAGVLILENLASLPSLPDRGAILHVLPLNIQGASEAPCRVYATLGVPL